MARNFMVGTVDDKPLLIVDIDDARYFVDLDARRVYIDEPGIPEVAEEALVGRVLKAADEMK